MIALLLRFVSVVSCLPLDSTWLLLLLGLGSMIGSVLIDGCLSFQISINIDGTVSKLNTLLFELY